METNDGVVEPVLCADPGDSEVELQDSECRLQLATNVMTNKL